MAQEKASPEKTSPELSYMSEAPFPPVRQQAYVKFVR